MKNFIVATLLLLFTAMTGLCLAQDATPTMGASTAAVKSNVSNDKGEIRIRFHNQLKRIAQGQKSGVLSKDQVADLEAKLKSIGEQAKADFQNNGRKPLTASQRIQINELLDENSKTIYQLKHPAQPTPDAVPSDGTESN
jgi:hypothetical protein